MPKYTSIKPDFSERAKWIEDAECKGMDPNVFYVDERGCKYPQQVVDVCKTCPVLEQCAEWFIHHEKHGYGGGMTPAVRQKIRNARNITVWEPFNNMLNSFSQRAVSQKFRNEQ